MIRIVLAINNFTLFIFALFFFKWCFILRFSFPVQIFIKFLFIIFLKTNTLKRPSPEPICDPASSPNTTNNNKPIPVTKKPKVTKKKKKRDPNEPQK